jgi:hypothetical protein
MIFINIKMSDLPILDAKYQKYALKPNSAAVFKIPR